MDFLRTLAKFSFFYIVFFFQYLLKLWSKLPIFYDSLPCFQLFGFFFFDYLLKWRIRRISIAKSIDFNVISQWRFCQYFWTVTCVFYARRADRPFSLFRSSAQSCIISVEHVLRPGSHDILYYIFYIIFFIFFIF